MSQNSLDQTNEEQFFFTFKQSIKDDDQLLFDYSMNYHQSYINNKINNHLDIVFHSISQSNNYYFNQLLTFDNLDINKINSKTNNRSFLFTAAINGQTEKFKKLMEQGANDNFDWENIFYILYDNLSYPDGFQFFLHHFKNRMNEQSFALDLLFLKSTYNGFLFPEISLDLLESFPNYFKNLDNSMELYDNYINNLIEHMPYGLEQTDHRFINFKNILIKLRDYGFKLNIELEDGTTPLLNSIKKQSPDLVQLLLDHGAQMNKKERMIALECVEKSNKQVLNVLMDNGLKIEQYFKKMNSNINPYDWLESNQGIDILGQEYPEGYNDESTLKDFQVFIQSYLENNQLKNDSNEYHMISKSKMKKPL